VLNPASDTELAGAPQRLAYTAEHLEDCLTPPAPERTGTILPSPDRDSSTSAAPGRDPVTQRAPDRASRALPAPERPITSLPATGQADARATDRGAGAQIGLGGATLLLLATIAAMSVRKRRA